MKVREAVASTARRGEQALTEDMLKILLIEDNPGHTALVREAFSASARNKEAVQWTVVGTLVQAHDHLALSAPDLILDDLCLPDGDSVERLPANDQGAVYPVVVMTSQGDEQAVVEAVKAGKLAILLQYQDHLEELAEKRTAELQQINEQLRREIAERRKAEDALRQSEKR